MPAVADRVDGASVKLNGHDKHVHGDDFLAHARDEQRVHNAYERMRALITLLTLHKSRDEFHKTMALLPMLAEYQRLPNTSDD